MIDAARLRELLDYDPATGALTRRDGGAVPGWTDADGYRVLRVEGRRYFAHRLAWLYTHGSWPPDQIDHINGQPQDNRLANLRPATAAQNSQNERQARASNRTSGLLGVTWHKAARAWMAQIKLNGKSSYLGLFDSPEAAHDAYLAAKRRLHEFGTI